MELSSWAKLKTCRLTADLPAAASADEPITIPERLSDADKNKTGVLPKEQ